MLQLNNSLSGGHAKQNSSEKVLSSAPGLKDYEEANKGRNMMVEGVVSPQSSHQNKVVFSEENKDADED